MITAGVNDNVSFFNGFVPGVLTNWNVSFSYEQPIPGDDIFTDRERDVIVIKYKRTAGGTDSLTYGYLSSHPLANADNVFINPNENNVFSINPNVLNTAYTYSIIIRFGLKTIFGNSAGGAKLGLFEIGTDTNAANNIRLSVHQGSTALLLISGLVSGVWYDIDYRAKIGYSGGSWKVLMNKIRIATISNGQRIWGNWTENTPNANLIEYSSKIRGVAPFAWAGNEERHFYYPRIAIAPNENLYNL